MDDQPAVILDYASPRKRDPLRLPARSVLEINCDVGRVGVVESLKAKGEAIGGMTFAIVMLLYMGALMLTERGRDAGWVLAPFWLAEAAVLVLVVLQTWRKTFLIVSHQKVSLRFTTPISSTLYEWPASHVTRVLAIITGHSKRNLPLGQLTLYLQDGGEVRLFTDHPADEIGPLAETILSVLIDREAGAD
jgi:hypothetical protein